MKKILSIAKFFCKLKLKYSLPSKIEFLVLDNVSSEKLNYVIDNNSKFILPIRFFSETKELYVNRQIIGYFLNFYILNGQKFFTAYLASVIKYINPKVAITFIDNSFKFSDLAKILHKDYPFIAVQQSSRYDFARHKYELKRKLRKENLLKNFFIPNLLCFGQHEIDDYKKYKLNIGKFFKVGSLSLANAFFYFKKKNIKIKKNKYDICIASDDGIGLDKTYKKKNIEEKYFLMTKYVIKYCMKFNKSFIFAWRREKKEPFKQEYNAYKKHLSKKEFQFLLNNSIYRNSKKKTTYKAVLQSNVVVGVATTLLREKLATRGKILSCNFTNLNIYNFPINGFFTLNKDNYKLFEKKLKKIYEMSNKEFNKKLGKKGEYLINLTNDKNIPLIKNEVIKIIDEHRIR